MWELILTAAGLSADAFSLSLCKGLSSPRITIRHMLITALYFGGFQALMPLFGYLLGERFRYAIESVDHWVAFSLLLCVGGGMIMESFRRHTPLPSSFSVKAMLPLALSASIDALAVGITFSIEKKDIRLASSLIGLITAGLCAVGVGIGGRIGEKHSATAQRAGGLILIFMGARVLFSHLT